MSLPKEFLWGAAIASNQTEGGYNLGGKGLSNVDILPVDDIRDDILQGKINDFSIDSHKYYPSHVSIDFYHHFKEDIQLLKEMGCKVLRVSIIWSRIFPTGVEDEPNEEGLKYYEDVFKELKNNGIEPFVSITHYDLPLNLIQTYGGWKNRKVVDLFVKYAEVVLKRYRNLVKYWIPMNEIDATLRYPYLVGGLVFSENDNKKQDMYTAIHHQFIAHAKTIEVGKKINPDFVIGCMVGRTTSYPISSDPKAAFSNLQYSHKKLFFMDVLVRGYYPNYALKEFEREGITIPFEGNDKELLKKNIVDFLSVPYYYSHVVDTNGKSLENPVFKNNKWGYTMDPLGIRFMLNELYDRYQIPLLVGECCIGINEQLENNTIEDDQRIDFLRQHIMSIKDAIEIDGVNVLGFTTWGTFDSISVSKGKISKRYGLIYVDKNDEDDDGSLKRYKKKSFYWFKDVISSNGENL